MHTPLILLFDIDGTLLTAQGAGRRALNRAFFELTGHPSAAEGIDLRGMTDPVIVDRCFQAIGLPASQAPRALLLEQYVALLEQDLAENGTAAVLPGVEALLDWIAASLPNAVVGLGTGNIEAGAYAKLRRLALDHHFAFGGFGSDHADRAEILRVGARRGAVRLGLEAGAGTTVVIGDTCKDVAAANAIGARCIAVGTGGIDLAELFAAGAALAVPTLEDPRVRSFLIAGAAGLPRLASRDATPAAHDS